MVIYSENGAENSLSKKRKKCSNYFIWLVPKRVFKILVSPSKWATYSLTTCSIVHYNQWRNSTGKHDKHKYLSCISSSSDKWMTQKHTCLLDLDAVCCPTQIMCTCKLFKNHDSRIYVCQSENYDNNIIYVHGAEQQTLVIIIRPHKQANYNGFPLFITPAWNIFNPIHVPDFIDMFTYSIV
jgi:hypothetical protein